MSFDARPLRPQRIAVVGGGISGMAAAYRLAPHHNVTLFESAKRLGGHARTVMAGLNGDQPVDTGFIVFNYVNYPHLTRMFQDLEVPVIKSDMSFGATIDNGSVEYGLLDLVSLYGQRRNLMRPGFARMVRDIFRFNARAEAAAQCDSVTIGELVKELDLGDWFQRYYLMPICGAIWSTPPKEIAAFPAKSLVSFFRNHALLSARGQHQWWTVEGGSIEYVSRLENWLRTMKVDVRTGADVCSVTRNGVETSVRCEGSEPEVFDQVIMACHSDDSLRLLTDASLEETAALSAIRYQDNDMILHRDVTQMPRRRACWASWVYKAETSKEETAIGVTYWMNRLQQIPESDPLFVSLNPCAPVQDELIYDQKTFRHPVFDRAALKAQKTLAEMQGNRNTWFAGAYLRHGFHEDGFASAVRVTRQLDKVCA
ncbi:NAD(P)/FAD-dependent oxidoreductase [Actibacterium pelagium]|uniref:Cyclopropane-fatty-acyl-phospholipid synthase n=1 Tax=Actibacterium pelagium TaxID=2029103 RepID=A0A917ABB1_9RHOB|nr:FAD-dependent oxidoreductase [Actibacterium pelagium]GGE38678.1 cyclopropane-fatty-acyl-phospholipid synthase [Actibacterium pelagium]